MYRYGVALYKADAMQEIYAVRSTAVIAHGPSLIYTHNNDDYFIRDGVLPNLIFCRTEEAAAATASALAQKFPTHQFCVFEMSEVHRSVASPVNVSKLTEKGLLPA